MRTRTLPYPDNDATNEFTYTFDAAGNLRTSGDGTTTTTYTHDGLLRRLCELEPASENRVD